MGVFGEPELILLCRGDQPFEEVCTKPSLKAATHHTDLRQKIPNVSAFEGRGDNEDHWSLACAPYLGRLAAGRRVAPQRCDAVSRQVLYQRHQAPGRSAGAL